MILTIGKQIYYHNLREQVKDIEKQISFLEQAVRTKSSPYLGDRHGGKAKYEIQQLYKQLRRIDEEHSS
jgi:hypothetical protein